MRRTLLGYGTVVSVFAGMALVLASSSEAGPTVHSVPAFLGQAQQASDYGCFPNSGGAVTQSQSPSCSGTRQFCVALPIDPIGGTGSTVQIAVNAPDVNHNLSCFAHSWTQIGTLVSASQRLSPQSFSSPQILTFTPLNIAPAGVLYACCDMEPTTTMFSISVSY